MASSMAARSAAASTAAGLSSPASRRGAASSGRCHRSAGGSACRDDHLPRAIRQRNARIERYRNLVRPIALHYHRCCAEPLDDLVQVGLLGLLRAAELYAPETGTPFDAYARPHVRGAILHYLRDHGSPVRLPRRLQEWQLQLQRWQERHAGGGLGQLDAAAAQRCRQQLGLSLEQWQRLMATLLLRRPLSLDAQATAVAELATAADGAWCGGGAAEVSLQPDAGAPHGADLDARGLDALALLPQLPPEQRLVVERVVLAGWSYRRVAAALQVSPMTVQRRLQRGLEQLRRRLQP